MNNNFLVPLAMYMQYYIVGLHIRIVCIIFIDVLKITRIYKCWNRLCMFLSFYKRIQ